MKDSQIITSDQEIDLARLFLLLFQHKWQILITTIIVLGAAVTFALLATPQYKVTSTWLPLSNSNSMSQMSNLASLVGINMGGQEVDLQAFFPQIIHSPTILHKIIQRKWPSLSGDSIEIASLVQLDTNNLKPQLPNISKKRLQESMLTDYLISCITYEATATMSILTVSTPDPIVSYSINRFLLNELQNYVEENRIHNTRQNRDFYYAKYQEFNDSLDKADQRLIHFQKTNHLIITPQQQMDFKRLQQESMMLSSLVMEFRKQYEMAEINLSKTTQPFHMLQEPQAPLAKYTPRRKVIAVVGLLIGFILGCLIVLIQFWWKSTARRVLRETKHP